MGFFNEWWKGPLMASPRNRVIYQYWAAFVANLPILITGLGIAWNGAFLADFVASNEASPLRNGQLTDLQMSWFPNMFSVGSVLGTIPCIWVPQIIGRQRTLFWLSLPQFVGWVMPLFTEYYSTLVSKFLIGLASGVTFVVTPTFVSEIADDNHRGSLGSFLSLFCNFGILLGFVLAVVCGYIGYSLVLMALSLCYLAAICTVVESPTFYELKGDDEMKKRVWSQYRNEPPPAEKPTAEQIKLQVKDFFSRENRRSVILAVVLIIFPCISGSAVMVNYTSIIFKEAGSEVSPAASSIIVAGIQFVGAYVATLLVDRAGRKILLISSFTGVTLSMTTMGLYYFLSSKAVDLSQLSFTPLVTFSCMMFFSAIGLAGVPFVLIGEILPEKLRGPMFTICLLIFTLEQAAGTWLFIPLRSFLGMAGYIWMFAALCAVACVITIFFVPETKGRSIEAITKSLQPSTATPNPT